LLNVFFACSSLPLISVNLSGNTIPEASTADGALYEKLAELPMIFLELDLSLAGMFAFFTRHRCI
jgi:hypothetical protein